MRIIGVDLHTRQQSIAMLDTETREVVEKTLKHEGEQVREFYSALPGPVQVGIEATGSMHWFLELMEELGIERKVGHPAKIRAAEPRKQKHDRRDAELLLQLQVENRFPSIWMPSTELRDLRTLLMHRHQWVRMRTRVQNALQAIALGRGLRRGKTLWSQTGQHAIESLPLPPHAAYRRTELQDLYGKLQAQINGLDERVMEHAQQRPGAKLLMTHPGVGPVTALATDVFLGDPWRFENGKALVSYVGMIPSEYSSAGRQRLGGLSKQGTRCCAFSGARQPYTPCDGIPTCNASTGASWRRRGWGKRESPQPVSWGFGSTLCCATRLITKSSVVVARCGRKAVVPLRGCQKWVIVLQSHDCETD